jgi:hypothetical protein
VNVSNDLHVQVSKRRDAELPGRPIVSALPELALAVLVLGMGFAASIDWRWVVAVACTFVAVGSWQAVRAGVELGRQRRVADEWLLWGAAARPSSALLSWRAGELSSPRMRSALAQSLRRIGREVRGRAYPGAVPLNGRAIRPHLGLLDALSERLADHDRPVSARGMVLVDRLLTEPGSPLYSRVGDELSRRA